MHTVISVKHLTTRLCFSLRCHSESLKSAYVAEHSFKAHAKKSKKDLDIVEAHNIFINVDSKMCPKAEGG